MLCFFQKDINIKLKDSDDHSGAKLDPNHNYFILVDDGSNDSYGKEITFRVNLETELRKGKYSDEYKINKSPSIRNSMKSYGNLKN